MASRTDNNCTFEIMDELSYLKNLQNVESYGNPLKNIPNVEIHTNPLKNIGNWLVLSRSVEICENPL